MRPIHCLVITLLLSLPLLACLTALPVRAEGALPVASVRDDFTELYRKLQQTHYDLYAHRSRKEYDDRFAAELADLDGLGAESELSRLDVQRRFQRFVAFGNVAHANIAFPASELEAYRSSGGGLFPLHVRIIDDALVVASNLSGNSAIARGDTLLMIDGEPAQDWVARLSTHVSADTARIAETLLEWRFPALMWLERGPVERFALLLRRADGSLAEVTVEAQSRDQMQAAARRAPPVFELDINSREARQLAGGVAYLRPGPFYDADPNATHPWDTQGFAMFVDDAFEQFIADDARALLIDLRANPGGDNSFSDLVLRWFASRPFRFASSFRVRVSAAAMAENAARLGDDTSSMAHRLAAAYADVRPGDVIDFELPLTAPREGGRFERPVFVLIDRHSYSNAVNVAAIVQDYGFATVMGEETADLATTYGAMEHFELPRTGIRVGFPKALIVRPNGDLTPRGVVPDIALPPAPLGATEDVVLASALKRLRSRVGIDAGK